MNRRFVLKAGLVLAATSHTAIAEEPAIAQVVESDHAKLKRLAWEISDLLNDLNPGYDYVTIQPSAVGKSAVLFMFKIKQYAAPIEDPLLDLLRDYKKGVADFYASSSDEEWDGLADATYGPHLARIDQWEGPALTREGAIEALKLSIDHVGGVADCDSAARMVRAAIGYLQAQA